MMRLDIVLSLCFLANVSQSKAMSIVEVPDDTFIEDNGNLTVLTSDLETMQLYWELTDGDTFEDISNTIQVESRCMRNMANRVRLRKTNYIRRRSNREWYDIVPDQLVLKEIPCETSTPVKWDYDFSMRKPNRLEILVFQSVSSDVINEVKIKKIFPYDSSLFSERSAKVVAFRWESYPAISSPDTGSGCFQSFDIGFDVRKVYIYWRRSPSHNVTVDIFKEEDGLEFLVGQEEGPWETDGSMSTIIGPARHRFVLKFFDEQGKQGTPKEINVPSQYRRKLIKNGDFSVTFEPDSKVNILQLPEVPDPTVVNYTVFLIDTFAGWKAVKTIKDFVYVQPNITSMEIKSDFFLNLGVSVNTKDSSSGLYIIFPGLPKIPGFILNT